MERDRNNFLMHPDKGSKICRAFGDCAPAWDMIGTNIGIVTMFASMSAPSKLNLAMATALLAALYDALIANMITLPLADKLHVKLEGEDVSRSLIIDGILLICDQKNSSLVRGMLLAYLPHHHLEEPAGAA